MDGFCRKIAECYKCHHSAARWQGGGGRKGRMAGKVSGDGKTVAATRRPRYYSFGRRRRPRHSGSV